MNYFTQDDRNALLSINSETTQDSSALQRVHRRMTELHRNLYPRLKSHGLDLHPNDSLPLGVSQDSVTASGSMDNMTLTYMRSRADALIVERVMGREERGQQITDPHRHPVIEVRLTPDHFVIELIVGPNAWYDQRNFLGKFTVKQHRQQLYKMLNRLEDEIFVGFWSGLHLGDMHLSTRRLPPPHILFEFIETFAPGRDYLRIGRWYDHDDAALDEDNIGLEVFNQVRELYDLYDYVVWSSNNNFHSFFEREYVSLHA